MGSNLPNDDDHFPSSLDAGYMCLVAKQLTSGQCDMSGGDVCSLRIMTLKRKDWPLYLTLPLLSGLDCR